jgi:hypothetical protein
MFARKAFRAGWGERLGALRGEKEFDCLARELFAWQFAANRPYRTLARSLGATPETVASWGEIPAVPQELFKRAALFCHPLAQARHTYHTSGTTTGTPGRQRLLADDLYRWAALRTAATVGPLRDRQPLFFLTPSPQEKPHSSLSAMFGFFRRAAGAGGSQFYMKDDALRLAPLQRALAKAVAQGTPVGLLGTAFAFVHLLDAGLPSLRLPRGSFLLETGGFKGRSREVAKGELYRALSRQFGVPDRAIWNEYGMTELSSQAYAHGANGEHRTSPWARVVIVDPATGREVAIGQRGLVRWIDLANVDGVLALDTHDLAVRTRTGFRLLGRLAQLPKRGCSLDAEDLRPGGKR